MTQPDSPHSPEASDPPACNSALARLTAAPNTDSAHWILASLRDFDYTVGSLVPPVFDAYARVFHPASRGAGRDATPVLWAEVARANRRRMHPAAEWGSLTGSWAAQRSTKPGLWDQQPSTGRLPRNVGQRLVAVLASHTADPARGYFGVWDGWDTPLDVHILFAQDTPEAQRDELQQRIQAAHASEVAAWRGLLDAAATFDLPHRPMHLLNGPLDAIEDFYKQPDAPSRLCVRDPPSLWWPADRSWCVATDIDLMTTYVGGTHAAIEALLADEHLEALPVPIDQSITWNADTINPLPPPP